MENKVSVNKEIWISYIDDSGLEVKGFFVLVEQTLNFIKIKSGSNILTIPYHKVNKIKERAENG